MRVPVEYRTASKKCYEAFCKANPHIHIAFDKWKEIIYTYNEMYVDYVLKTGDAIKLPWGFGKISVNKSKQRATRKYNGKTYINLAIDWKRTKQEGKYVYHLNHHTHGYKFRWKWFGTSALFFQSDVWNFRPSRVVSRKLTQYLKDKKNPYIDLYREWNYKYQFK